MRHSAFPQFGAALVTPTLGILVVDDDLAVRNLLRALLEGHGYHVWTAQNGVDALQVYAERVAELQLVFTDISISIMGGLALANAIRNHNPGRPVLCIFGSFGEYWTSLKGVAVL